MNIYELQEKNVTIIKEYLEERKDEDRLKMFKKSIKENDISYVVLITLIELIQELDDAIEMLEGEDDELTRALRIVINYKIDCII